MKESTLAKIEFFTQENLTEIPLEQIKSEEYSKIFYFLHNKTVNQHLTYFQLLNKDKSHTIEEAIKKTRSIAEYKGTLSHRHLLLKKPSKTELNNLNKLYITDLMIHIKSDSNVEKKEMDPEIWYAKPIIEKYFSIILDGFYQLKKERSDTLGIDEKVFNALSIYFNKKTHD